MEGFESREELLRKILIDLKDDQVNIVGVYGMGGCGKTTLAKEVAYKRATDLFDKRVVVEVSEVPNIKGIQNQIAGGIGLMLDDMHTIAERARILYNQLKSEKKKILIILDNVWKKLKLDEVGIPPHECTKDFCCKLLITTREEHVCRLMDVQEANIHKVGLLNETEALNLFEKQTDKKVGRGEFKDVADRLLRKCGRLPLAIATTASAISFIDKGKERMTLVESIPRWMCKETFEKFTAISLMSGHDFSPLSGVNAPLLEILLLKGDISLTTLDSDFFKGMKNLKVLSLSNLDFNDGLPESIGELECLQTLHLHHCMLKDVKLIGKLVNLLVLSLRESTLEELAVEIGELSNLRLLDIGSCKGMKRIPANILSRLSNLEGLYMLNSFDGWASTNIEVNEDEGRSNQASGSELDTLSHLNVLEMEVSEAAQLLTVNKGELIEQLGKFKIRVRKSNRSPVELPPFRYVLELIDIDASPNKWLRALLKKTECLVLRDCYFLPNSVVPELDEDGFKDLKYLKAEYCKLKFVISSDEENESMAFANLEILELRSMDNIKMICDGKASVGMFSNLRRLKLHALTYLESGLPLTSALLNLSEVSIDTCPSLKSIAYKDNAENETEVDMFPCLKSLHLYNNDNLSSVVGQSRNEGFALFNTEVSCQVLVLSCNSLVHLLRRSPYTLSLKIKLGIS